MFLTPIAKNINSDKVLRRVEVFYSNEGVVMSQPTSKNLDSYLATHQARLASQGRPATAEDAYRSFSAQSHPKQ